MAVPRWQEGLGGVLRAGPWQSRGRRRLGGPPACCMGRRAQGRHRDAHHGRCGRQRARGDQWQGWCGAALDWRVERAEGVDLLQEPGPAHTLTHPLQAAPGWRSHRSAALPAESCAIWWKGRRGMRWESHEVLPEGRGGACVPGGWPGAALLRAGRSYVWHAGEAREAHEAPVLGGPRRAAETPCGRAPRVRPRASCRGRRQRRQRRDTRRHDEPRRYATGVLRGRRVRRRAGVRAAGGSRGARAERGRRSLGRGGRLKHNAR
mmetsp:Transcript_47526/g.146384  ORF Transcript_47526/g.146384 Transcript_47526/m.146384 type:complete len:263 (+) Transcript_47526:685-1473(+)